MRRDLVIGYPSVGTAAQYGVGDNNAHSERPRALLTRQGGLAAASISVLWEQGIDPGRQRRMFAVLKAQLLTHQHLLETVVRRRNGHEARHYAGTARQEERETLVRRYLRPAPPGSTHSIGAHVQPGFALRVRDPCATSKAPRRVGPETELDACRVCLRGPRGDGLGFRGLGNSRQGFEERKVRMSGVAVSRVGELTAP